MKKLTRIMIFALLICAILVPVTVGANGFRDDKVIFGGNFTLDEGETLNGDLVVFGGNVNLRTSSTVNGDAVVLGGNVTVDGAINGNLVALGGIVEIYSNARVIGDLTVMGSSYDQEEGAYIAGDVVTGENIPFTFELPENLGLFNGDFPSFQVRQMPFVTASWFFFQILIWTGLAILVALLIQNQAPVINQAALEQPVMSFVVGLGIAFIAPLVLLALLITILLSPVSFLGFFALVAAWVVGLVSISIEIGKRVAQAMDQTWAVPIQAGVGMLLLSLLFNGFQHIVPCVGFLPKLILGMWVTGAVLLTRFGTRAYPTEGLATKPVESSPADQAELPPAFPKEEPKQAAAEINATKAAMDLANSEGIDLTSIKGTGAEGRITINDVRKAVKNR